MGKVERVSRAAKRTGSQKARSKARQGVRNKGSQQIKAKASRRNRKTVRRVTVFKSTSWYQTAVQSIAISPRAAP